MSHRVQLLLNCQQIRVAVVLSVLMLMAITSQHAGAAGTLYWSTDRIKRASTDGDCRQSIREAEINAEILDVDFNPETSKLYFIYRGTIRRCDLDGAHPEVVYAPSAGTGAAVLDIDRINRKIYWTDNSGPPHWTA
jgi:hypothetical protein